jgi:pseudouridine synthase
MNRRRIPKALPKAMPSRESDRIPAEKIRLNKYLASCGLGSRRACDVLIAGGEVVVNGQRVRELGVQIDPTRDRVRVRGEDLQAAAILTYVALNKPAGYVTSAKDEKDRRTVLDLVKMPVRVYPVGRLDRDSEGLLLLTNDGDLAFRLTHPRFKVPRVYRVLVDAPVTEAHTRKFHQGVRIEDGMVVRGDIKFPYADDRAICEVTIHQGRNRQVRRMFAALGYRTKGLQRVAIGPLQLGRLRIGEWRHLSPREVQQLKEAVRVPDGNSR